MKIIDLSQTLVDQMEVYPGDPQVHINQVHDFESHSWSLSELHLGSHTGTHVDAFSHMDINGLTLSEIPLTRFIGEAYLADGLSKYPFQKGLLFDLEKTSDDFDSIMEADPNFVGGNIDEELERLLLNHGVITYTRLINLDQLPLHRPFTFIGLPLKIKDGDGSPVRAIAIVEED